jgi:V/A-type H+-transporting ATPase subunit K
MRKRILWIGLVVAPILAVGLVVPLLAAPEVARATSTVPSDVVRWGFMAAALAAGLAAVGAAYAVAIVGAAAMGVIAEKPEMAGRALIFVGLAEGIAIYGLIIAIMILGRLE